MEVGANPVAAANLMKKMAQPHTPLQAPLLPSPGETAPALKKSPAGESNEDKKPKAKPKPKMKKEKAPAPQLHGFQGNMPRVFFQVTHPPFFGAKGASLEVLVPESAEVGLFVQAWVTAASDAAGQCAKLTADLEPLESQQALIQLIAGAADGISASRKALTALGPAPGAADVAAVLANAACLYSGTCNILVTCILVCGKCICSIRKVLDTFHICFGSCAQMFVSPTLISSLDAQG